MLSSNNSKNSIGLASTVNWSKGTTIKRLANTNSLYLTLIFIILLSLGLANLYSASLDARHYFNTQSKNLVISVIAFIVVGWFIPIKVIKTYATPTYIALIITLIVVLALGHTAGGSQRWINLGPIRFQPSEIAKVIIAITVAKWFYVNQLPFPYRLRDLWSVIALSGLVFGLIFLQPDLGTAGICLIITAIQTIFMQLNKKSVAIVFFSGLISGVVGWNFFLHSYQKLRILNLLNPSLDP
jgi:rod shape determining protein RodA